MMAHTKDSVNYKNNLLISIINKLLPNGEVAWEAVCTAYFNQSKEKVLCNTMDVRKHWLKNLCNNMQKPTGRMGKNGDRIHWCMLIENKIMKKTHSGMLGLSSDSDSSSFANGDENLGGGVDEGEGTNDVLGGFDFDLECNDEGNQITNPSLPPPICRSNAKEEVEEQAMVAGTNDEKDVTLPPASDVVNCIKSKGSSIKSGKTKNSSNKNKERTSIAGAIVKLIEQGQPAGGASCELSANMTMMLMRQLDSMSRSMDERERCEEKRKKKERKCQKKRHAKKRRKKARKRVTYEGLEDHRGKAAGKYSSSSDSDSSNCDTSDCSSNGSSQSSNYGWGSWRQADKIN
jgi:hypothetical protein